jgi:LEA14-like dessication related protein
MKKVTKVTILFLIIGLSLTSCGVYNSIMNLSKLQYKLGSVNNFKVGNILINNKSKISDFNAVDILNLTSKVASGDFPVSFTLNVLAKNPNQNTTTSNTSEITLESFPWTLYIDGVKTISGNISSPVTVPSVKSATIIPLQISLDMLDFFKENGLSKIVNLALTLGGKNGSTSKIKIVAEPTLGTPLGRMTYPSPITIIDKTFN